MNTSRSAFSQSTCTAWEMQPFSWRERWTCSRLSRRISAKLSWRATTLPVTTIMLLSHPSVLPGRLGRCQFAAVGDLHRLLRPSHERRASGIRQRIDAALDAVEPAVEIVAQDVWRMGKIGLQFADP